MVGKKRFFRLVRANFKRAFGIPFVISVLLVVCFLIFDLWSDFKYRTGGSVWYYYFFSVVMMGTYSTNIFPILAAIPFSASYCEEQNSGLTSFIVARSSQTSYCAGKMLVCAIIGGLTLSCGILIHMSLFSLSFPLTNSEALRQIKAFPYALALEQGTGLQYFLIGAYLAFLRGALCASAAMTVSAFILNKYVVIASPLILNFVLVRGCNLLHISNNARLDLLLRGRSEISTDKATLFWLTFIILMLIVICGLIFQRRIKRRILNESVS